MKKKALLLVRSLAFLLVLGVAVVVFTGPLTIDEQAAYNHVGRFRQEATGRLDAVMVGASNVHFFWQPVFGWMDYGITVWSYSAPNLPYQAMKGMIEEARKTQPDALYILSLNTFRKEMTATPAEIHRAVDFLPLSANRVNLVETMSEKMNLSAEDKLEYYLPVLRFHSRWDELSSWSYGATTDYKSSKRDSGFYKVFDMTGRLKATEVRSEVSDEILGYMLDLLDYCDREHLKVLFTIAPQSIPAGQIGTMNSLKDLAAERGYPCLDLMEDYESVGFDPETDFLNTLHTNVHGSKKYSYAVGRYLVEHYGFEDKRGKPEWQDWEEAAERYRDYVSRALLEFEWDNAPRADLDAPKLVSAKGKEQTITLTWEASEGAESYQIYRKRKQGWEWTATLDAETTGYTDIELLPDSEYTYTVVPCRTENGAVCYGRFNVNGITGKTKAKEKE